MKFGQLIEYNTRNIFLEKALPKVLYKRILKHEKAYCFISSEGKKAWYWNVAGY